MAVDRDELRRRLALPRMPHSIGWWHRAASSLLAELETAEKRVATLEHRFGVIHELAKHNDLDQSVIAKLAAEDAKETSDEQD